jgi:hypothetical protein
MDFVLEMLDVSRECLEHSLVSHYQDVSPECLEHSLVSRLPIKYLQLSCGIFARSDSLWLDLGKAQMHDSLSTWLA